MGTTTKHAMSLSGYNTREYGSANTQTVLLGNKKDHEDHEVSTEEGHKLARMHRVKFYETSALTEENCDAKFCPSSNLYLTTKAPGCIAYMPPECLVDHPHFTEKGDVFSFGVVVW